MSVKNLEFISTGSLGLACLAPIMLRVQVIHQAALSGSHVWTGSRSKSVAEIFEISGDAKVAVSDELDDCLQFVFLFPSHADLSVLQLAL